MAPTKPESNKRKTEDENKVPEKKNPTMFFGESDAALDKRVTDAVITFLADTNTAFRVVGQPS